MRSGIGNSPTDPFYVSQSAATTDAAGNPIVAAGTVANPMSTTPRGAGSIAAGQVAVTTSATQVVAARAGRASVTLSSATAVAFWVGPTGVTSANGFSVPATAGTPITILTSAAVFAVGASAVTITYLEIF